MTAMDVFSVASHNLTVSSQDAEATSFPLGENTAEWAELV